MIQDGSKVRLHLVMAVDGEVVDNTMVDYVHGEGGLLGGLQEHLLGLEVGARTECSVPPDKAYGDHNPDRLLRVRPADFGDDLEQLRVGSILHGVFSDVECDATVLEITEDSVVLDMNHPLAGKTLRFAVEVVEVHPSTQGG